LSERQKMTNPRWQLDFMKDGWVRRDGEFVSNTRIAAVAPKRFGKSTNEPNEKLFKLLDKMLADSKREEV